MVPAALARPAVVWEIGNVLSLALEATRGTKKFSRGLDHAITRDLSRFFTLGVDNETVNGNRNHRRGQGSSTTDSVDAARRFNARRRTAAPGSSR